MLGQGQTRSAKFLANSAWVLDLGSAFESRRRAGNIRKRYFTAWANSARLPLRLALPTAHKRHDGGYGSELQPFFITSHAFMISAVS